MPKVKSISAISEKWARVTPQRSEDYRAGIASPRTPWAAATAAATDRYKAGVTESIAQGRFEKGVAKAGDAKWSARAQQLGTPRFAEGVAASQGEYQAGIAPFIRIIESTTLPQRYARGDPRNIERVKVMATALRKGKTG